MIFFRKEFIREGPYSGGCLFGRILWAHTHTHIRTHIRTHLAYVQLPCMTMLPQYKQELEIGHHNLLVSLHSRHCCDSTKILEIEIILLCVCVCVCVRVRARACVYECMLLYTPDLVVNVTATGLTPYIWS